MAEQVAVSSSSKSVPTDPDLINFFRLCRIVLEDIPDVLRNIFKEKILTTYKQEWIDGRKSGQWFLQKERFQSRLTAIQKQLLGSGQSSKWDVSLLVHVLLYSSQLFLVDYFRDNEVTLKHDDRYKLVSTSRQADFTRCLRQRDVILCDIGHELVKNEVKYVTPTDIIMKYPIKQHNLPPSLRVFQCGRDWLEVDALSKVRNTQFAHCRNARIDASSLNRVVQNVEASYQRLRRPRHRIETMISILTESYIDDISYRKVKYYQDKWHDEIAQFVELKEDVDHLHSDVTGMELILKDMEKGSQVHQQHIEKQQLEIKGLQADVSQTSESISGIKIIVEEKAKDTSCRLVSIESRQQSMEKEQLANIVKIQEQQRQMDSRVSGNVDFIKQVSDDQKTVEENIRKTEKQLSEETEKTVDLIHQLSVQEDESHSHIKTLQEDVDDIKFDIVMVKEEIDTIQRKEPSTKLSISHFESDISYFSAMFHAGTRQWLFDDISAWKMKASSNRNQPNICIVSGNPGMGKTVLAAKLCTTNKINGTFAGCFFFQHHVGRRSNPKMLVQSLCHQFQSTIQGYSKLIEEEVSKIDPEAQNACELFSYLIKEPLSCLSSHPDSMMVVIDALDECDYDCRSDLIKLLIREFIKLPRWIQVILTTRPDKKILHSLRKIKSVIKIIPEDPRNLDDIRIFLRDFLKDKMSNEEFYPGVELLVKKSEGMFLYFYYAIDMLQDNEVISLQELKDLLPDGIDDYYQYNFKRLFDSLGQEQYHVFLQGILMARSDFPQDLVGHLLGITKEASTKIVSMISTLFPLQNNAICIFHKSVKDWLLDKELAEEYAIDRLAGHKDLAVLCQAELKTLKGIFPSLPLSEVCNSPVYRFIVQNVVYHTCHGGTLPQVLSIIEDLQFLYLHLIYNNGVTSSLLNDITEALKSSSKSKKIHQALLDYAGFIARHSHVLDGIPSLIIQCTLNEPDPFSERLGISCFLADPFRAFPGLKVLLQVKNKSEQFASPLVTFVSDDNITSCLLLQESNLLVCSDCGCVYFWNVQTGEAIGKTDLKDEFSFPYGINICSASPDQKLIAYGSPSEGLNLDGEKVPLLDTLVEHKINTCIFSPDGEKLLTFAFFGDGIFRLFKEIQMPLKLDYHVELWSTSKSTCQKLHIVRQEENRPMCACFSADGKKIFCGYRNGIIVQWDSVTYLPSAYLLSPDVVLREDLKEMDLELIEEINIILSICVSQNGYFLAVSTGNGLQIWDAAALAFIFGFQPENSRRRYTNCSFSHDNSHLAAGTGDGYLEIFAIADFTFNRIVSIKPDGSSNPLTECLFVDSLKVLCTFGNTAHVYELTSLIQMSTRKKKTDIVHPGIAHISAILPHKQLAFTLGDKSLCLWDVGKCELKTSAVGIVGGSLLRLSADGKTLLTYGDRCYIEVWEVDSLTKTNDLIHLKQRNLPIGHDDPDESSPSDICHCAVSVNGIVVGGTGNGDLFVWHGKQLEFVKELKGHGSLITFVEFSPSAAAFVSADMDGVVMMWQLPNDIGPNFNVSKVPLVRHDDSVEGISYSSQGRRIVTCSMDKSIHLYNGPSGDLVAKLTNHNAGIMRVTFSCNEQFIASGDEKGEIIIWDGFTGQLLQHIKPRVRKSALDLQFVKQDQYICVRDSNSNCITLYEVGTGAEVSRLSFTTEIFTMSASTFWKETSYLLCCLKDGLVKFVEVVDPDSVIDLAG